MGQRNGKKSNKKAQPFYPLFSNTPPFYDELSIVTTYYIEKLFAATFENNIWFIFVYTSFLDKPLDFSFHTCVAKRDSQF